MVNVKKLSEAQDCLEQASMEYPSDNDLKDYLTRVTVWQGRYKDALRILATMPPGLATDILRFDLAWYRHDCQELKSLYHVLKPKLGNADFRTQALARLNLCRDESVKDVATWSPGFRASAFRQLESQGRKLDQVTVAALVERGDQVSLAISEDVLRRSDSQEEWVDRVVGVEAEERDLLGGSLRLLLQRAMVRQFTFIDGEEVEFHRAYAPGNDFGVTVRRAAYPSETVWALTSSVTHYFETCYMEMRPSFYAAKIPSKSLLIKTTWTMWSAWPYLALAYGHGAANRPYLISSLDAPFLVGDFGLQILHNHDAKLFVGSERQMQTGYNATAWIIGGLWTL